jgi:hypothetical protein
MGHIITECPLIPDPELNLQEMPEVFDRAVSGAISMLKSYGINDEIDVGLKQFSGEQRCWLAMYMRESQFQGTPRFFINTQTPGIIDAAVLPQAMTVEDVMTDSFLHEYGHVIEEWAKRKNPEMYRLIYGPFSDEEDFAEYMVDFFRYKKDRSARRDAAEKVIRMYVADVF